MQNSDLIRCRVAACREALDDGKEWSFYLLNDSNAPLDLAVLYEIGYEWGNWGDSDAEPGGPAPGAEDWNNVRNLEAGRPLWPKAPRKDRVSGTPCRRWERCSFTWG